MSSTVEMENKAWWAIKKLNFDMQRVGLKRFLDLNELEEMRNKAYMNSKISKDKLKRWHDQIVLRKEFQEDKSSCSCSCSGYKIAPPPSRPIQFLFTKAPKKKLTTDEFYRTMTSRKVYPPSVIYFKIDGRQGMLNTKMVARALDIPLTPPNPTEFQPITQTEDAEMV
ncbi:hypothetical protein CK203_091415 [Vitis vinifera]|uniref:Uncharacterized protein n=1 Tax=Vitis vinifera TaxID=29760 RepID=A0A438CM27_VITVI|nr:hypothetical protein CK203_091415 [Vitis vinifera]